MQTSNYASTSPVPKRSEFNFFSKWTFSYLNQLTKRGAKRDISISEYPGIEDRQKSQDLSQKLMTEWENESKKDNPRLIIPLIKVFGFDYFLAGLAYFIEVGFKIGQALLLGKLLDWFQEPNGNISGGLTYGIALSAMAFGHVFLHHIEFFLAMRTGLEVRVSFVAAIYRKCLLLSISNASSTGQIVNLVSNDVQRFEDGSPFFHFLWLGPLELILVTYLMYLQISWAAFPAVASLLFFIPIQGFFAQRFGSLRKKAVYFRDERIKTLSDMISGIMIVKLYAWEDPFKLKIETLRNKELQYIRQGALLRSFNDASFFSSSAVVLFFAFISFSLMGGILTPSKVFVCVILLQAVRLDMTNFFPKAVQCASESIISLKRIQDFLTMPNISDKRTSKESIQLLDSLSLNGMKPVMISVKDAYFSWPGSLESNYTTSGSLIKPDTENIEMKTAKNTLSNINFTIPKGTVFGICGPVGCGKSSLLNAILGELDPISGSVSVRSKSIGYAGQSAWILSGTIKENILFGREFNSEWFIKVIESCSLDKDLDNFPLKEETIIGERGVTLSGGQRARLALARAVYMDAEIYLFDDPLSAVDSKVGQNIFNSCIRGILRGKTIILVTHLLQYIKLCDSVMLLENGNVMGIGSFEEVMRSENSNFAAVMNDFSNDPESSLENANSEVIDEIKQSVQNPEFTVENKDNQEVTKEKMVSGGISRHVYFKYFKSGMPIANMCFLFLFMVAGQGFLISTIFWLSIWSKESEEIQNEKKYFYIYIYVGLVIMTVALSIVRAVWFYLNCITSGRYLFQEMLHSVFNAPMDFFHSSTHGRIMNRFSKDMNLVDETLPATAFDFFQCAFMIFGSIIVTVIVFPYALIILPFISVAFIYLRRYYLATSRQIKRQESVTRSPVYGNFPSTIEGLAVIRAFSAENRFLERFFHTQDENTRVFFSYLSISRWLGFRLDILAASVIFILAILCVMLKNSAALSGGSVGLVFTYLLENLSLCQWATRQSAELENLMVSTERLLEYTMLPSEASRRTDLKLPDVWPFAGGIEFKNMSLKYPRGEIEVLKNLELSITPGKKIGIVGRTGAGKSSLIQALFRLVEPFPTHSIIIDGIPISELGLNDLRSKISIIPQEPFCFKGTLRFNLDPFSLYTDAELWSALEVVEMKISIEKMSKKLECAVDENGSNWSVGERQLICLARAILKNSKLVIMDEATSNVDVRTDACIQKAIRSGIFSNATILTIAHRLNTIIDYDFILVIDNGSVVEYGPVVELMEKDIAEDDAYFSRMLKDLDAELQTLLKQKAKMK